MTLGKSMEIDDLLQVYVMAGDQLDALWEFFVTVHLAIAASLYGIERLRILKVHEYFLLSIGYLAFSIINLRAKHQAYEFLIAVELELEKILSTTEFQSLKDFFSNIEFTDRVHIVWIVHIATIAIIIALAITKHKKISHKPIP